MNMADKLLKKEIAELRKSNQVLWSLLVDVTRKMQGTTAAIKASVTSLLDYEIILDASTQHELLEIIENSTDQVSRIVMLLTLVSKIESNTFSLSTEPIEITEVLTSAKETVIKNYPNVDVKLKNLSPGNPACIDYDYLSIAIVMVSELIIENQKSNPILEISTMETNDCWFVDFEVINNEIFEIFSRISHYDANDLFLDFDMLPISKLKFFVVRKIFDLLSIDFILPLNSEEDSGIRLMIPIVKNDKSST